MVRANLSKATAEAVDPTPLPTQAERIQQLGEHIDNTLKVHVPADDEQPSDEQSQTADAGLAGEGEVSTASATAEMIRLPFTGETTAFVFVRHIDAVTSEGVGIPAHFEAAVFFNGECVTSETGYPTRRAAVVEIERELYKYLAERRHSSEACNLAAHELNTIIAKISSLPEGEEPAAGEACEWPIVVDEEAVATIAAESADDAPPPAAPLAGKGEVSVAIEPEATPAQRLARIRLAYTTAVDRWKENCEHAQAEYIEASLARLEADTTLKALKSTEKKKLAEVGRILKQHPHWETFEREDDRRSATSAPNSPAATSDSSTSTTPAFPSPDSTLPPPVAESSPTSPQANEAQPSAGPVRQYRADWQSADVAELGLTEYVTGKLRDAGIKTMGKLCDAFKDFNGLQDIDGIGQVKSDAISDALIEWSAKNVDPAPAIAAREAGVAVENVAMEAAAQSQ